jgi:hypothetical protein
MQVSVYDVLMLCFTESQIHLYYLFCNSDREPNTNRSTAQLLFSKASQIHNFSYLFCNSNRESNPNRLLTEINKKCVLRFLLC